MATGGYQPTKEAKSESKGQANWQRSVSSDDAQSSSSDLRINNWQQNSRQDSKHQKKSKDNPERERVQSLLAESPPIEKRHHTPSSYPRTKITPSTPTSQRVALENLKQHITFSDDDDQVSTDVGAQKSWGSRRKKLQNGSLNRSGSGDDVRGQKERTSNSKNNMQYSHDDEMSQSLGGTRQKNKMETSSDGDEKDRDDCEQMSLRVEGHLTDSSNSANTTKMDNVILPGQESLGGATVLGGLVVPSSRQELINILRQKEQQLQAVMNREAELNTKVKETAKKIQEAKVKDDKATTSLAALSEGRKFIEHNQSELQMLKTAIMDAATRMVDRNEEEKEDTENGGYSEDMQLKSNIIGVPESNGRDNTEVQQVNNLPNELLELKRQFSFLRNEFSLMNQAPNNVETETRALRDGRLELQNKLEELQNKKQLDQLMQHLQVVQSQYSNQSQNSETDSRASSSIQQTVPTASGVPLAHPPRPQPPQPDKQTKLRTSSNSDLHTNLHAGAREQVMLNVRESSPRKGGNQPNAGKADYLLLQEMQEKLRQLQLQAESQGGTSYKEGQRKLQHEQIQPLPEQKKSQHKQLQQQHHLLYQPQNNQQQPNKGVPERPHQFGHQQQSQGIIVTEQSDDHDDHSDEDNVSATKSDDLWPDFGSWEHGDEMKEKIRKLRAAKENLRELQNLVALAERSSDSPRVAVGDLRDLGAVGGQAGSLPHVPQTREFTTQAVTGPQRDDEEGDDLSNPRAGIEKLRRERAMLMELRNKLQGLQNQKSSSQKGGPQESKKQNSDNVKLSGLNQPAEPVVVTFASNDELYNKIRRQRILHEELQTKKRELEDIVRNKNNRRNSQNHDYQNDMSLNPDSFGISASVDATVATWGSSTADNPDNGSQDESEQEELDEDDHDDHDVDDDDKRTRGDTGVKLPFRRQGKNNRNQQQQEQFIKQWPQQDYGQSKKDMVGGDTFQGQYSKWFNSIESRLSSLTTAVDALIRKSQTDNRQRQETDSQGRGAQLYPVQEQMLQLQTTMLGFNQLVQSMTRQQADIQFLHQQIHALQLQIQALSNQQSFSGSPSAGGGLSNRSRPPLSHPTVYTGGYQSGTRPNGVERSSSRTSSGLGVDHAVGAGGSLLSLPQERMTASFVLPLGQSSFDQHHHQASHEESSVSTTVNDVPQLKEYHSAQDEKPLSRDYSNLFRYARRKKRSQANSVGGNSNTENVRDAIYAEVNSLITQNESRPYFLLELFQDMQQIDSDVLRQQTLTSLQRILKAHSTSNMATSFTECQEEITPTERNNQLAKPVRNSAMVTTPVDCSETENSRSSIAALSIISTESSTFQYPQVDMKQLDQQIKTIMMKLIPVVKLHLNDLCSSQLLSYIRHLITSLVDRLGDQEFVQLFQHQLATLLETTLLKFEGRRMRECGEAMLVDISDVLYNELAFFRLMQNLDEPAVDGSSRTREWTSEVLDSMTLSTIPTSRSCLYRGDEDNVGEDNSFDSNKMLDNGDNLRFGWLEQEPEKVTKDRTEREASKRELKEEVFKRENETREQQQKTELESRKTRRTNRPGNVRRDKRQKVKDQCVTATSEGSAASLSSPQTVVPSLTAQVTERDVEVDEDRQQLTKTAIDSNITNNHEETVVHDPSLTLLVPVKDNTVNAPLSQNEGSEQRRTKYEEEQTTLNGLDAILASLGGMEELAGDEMSVLDPDYFMS